MSYDNTCKYLAESYPADFAWWLLGVEAARVRVLKTELSAEPIRADSVSFLRVGNRILHLEFETDPYSQPPIPLRMLDYGVRLKRKYRLDVEQFVIFLQESGNEIVFTNEYSDRTTTHRYGVIRLWEQDPGIFLENPGLLPLAVLAKSDTPETLLERVAQRVDTIENEERRHSIAACSGILAGLRLSERLISQFFREDIMRQSVVYQRIFREGEQKGKQEGRQEEALSIVLRLVRSCLGELPSTTIEGIQCLSTQQLENLAEDLFDFSKIADLEAWLRQPRQ